MRRTEYQTPKRLLQALADCPGGVLPAGAILDLGCGTGLCGELFRSHTPRLDGVDISAEMISVARAKGIYDALHVHDILAFLQASADRYDLIVAGGVMQYFAGLGNVLQAVRGALGSDGVFAFTIDRLDQEPADYIVCPYDAMMFCHHPRHVRAAAARSGFEVLACHEFDDRKHWGNPDASVAGAVFVLQRDP